MHIGLIGGIGPAATDFYYKRIVRAFSQNAEHLELTMVHADAATLLNNLANDNHDDQLVIYQSLATRLVTAGANCVVVTSIAGHFCIAAFKEVSPLPVIDMIEETNTAIKKMGIARIGILGTQTVMESKFYGGIENTEIVVPRDGLLQEVHKAYVEMATSGFATDEHRKVFLKACKSMDEDDKAQAILLGGTDLALVFNEKSTEHRFIDCAAIHCDAVINKALKM